CGDVLLAQVSQLFVLRERSWRRRTVRKRLPRHGRSHLRCSHQLLIEAETTDATGSRPSGRLLCLLRASGSLAFGFAESDPALRAACRLQPPRGLGAPPGLLLFWTCPCAREGTTCFVMAAKAAIHD